SGPSPPLHCPQPPIVGQSVGSLQVRKHQLSARLPVSVPSWQPRKSSMASCAVGRRQFVLPAQVPASQYSMPSLKLMEVGVDGRQQRSVELSQVAAQESSPTQVFVALLHTSS